MGADLKSQAAIGIVWIAVGKYGQQAVHFVVSLVLARLLSPGDYGVIGILSIFINISYLLLDSGFGQAIIQRKELTEVDCSTAFYFNAIVGSVLYIVFYAAAPFIAAFYNMPILTDVTRVVALPVFVNGLAIVQKARLTRALDFKTPVLVGLVSYVCSSAAGLALAYAGYGVWALAWCAVVGALTQTIGFWIVAKWRPLGAFSRDSFKALWGFGSKLVVTGFINTIYSDFHTLVIGKFYTPADLGQYNRASAFAALPGSNIANVVSGINYPILCKIQDDREKLIRVYGKLLKVPMFLLVPAMFGMAAVAAPMVEVLVGKKWLECVPYLVILCIAWSNDPLTTANLNLLNAKGRTDLILKLECIKKPIGFIILIVSLLFGIKAMCFGKLIYGFIAFAINTYYTKKLLDFGLWKQVKEVLPIYLNSIIMYGVVWMSIRWLSKPMMQLVVGVLVGTGAYLLLVVARKDETFVYLFDFITKKIRHRS